MVFFSCEGCNETLKKAQVENHIRRCGCPVSCVDCSKVFPGMTYAQVRAPARVRGSALCIVLCCVVCIICKRDR